LNDFLTREHSEENLHFYLDVQQFKYWPDPIFNRAFTIYKKYIKIDAPKAININQQTRTDIEFCFLQYEYSIPRTIFNAAQKNIYTLMERDSFRRFIMSPECKEMKEKLQQQVQKSTSIQQLQKQPIVPQSSNSLLNNKHND